MCFNGPFFLRLLQTVVFSFILLQSHQADAGLHGYATAPQELGYLRSRGFLFFNENRVAKELVFPKPGIVGFDLTVDSATVITLTEDGSITPEEGYPTAVTTGVFNQMATEWQGFVSAIEILELRAPFASAPYFLPTTNEVSGYFSEIYGFGTDRIRLYGGTVPADPTPGTSADAPHLRWTVQMNLPQAGKYRVLQWPALTSIPEPSTLLLALAGFSVLGIRRR